mgnify:CR=1 FL=1
MVCLIMVVMMVVVMVRMIVFMPVAMPVSVGATLRRPEVGWFFLGMFFTVLAHTAIYAFYSLYLDRLGYSKGQVGALWAVSVAAAVSPPGPPQPVPPSLRAPPRAP